MTFRDMVLAIRAAVGSCAILLPVPGRLVPALTGVLGIVLRDVVLTRAEYQAMAAGLADSDAPSTGQVVFTDWVARHGPSLGLSYANELDLHFRPSVMAAPAAGSAR